MRIVITARPDPRRVPAAVRWVSRWLFRAFYVVGAVVVGLGVFSAVALPGDPVLDGVIILLGLFCLAYPFGVVGAARRQQDRYQPMTIRYEIDDDGVLTAHELGESTLNWPAIERAALTTDLLLIWVSKRQYFPIPVTDLSKSHRRELRDLLQEQGLLRRS